MCMRDDNLAAVEMVKQGKSIAEVMRLTGKTRNAVRSACLRAGIDPAAQTTSNQKTSDRLRKRFGSSERATPSLPRLKFLENADV